MSLEKVENHWARSYHLYWEDWVPLFGSAGRRLHGVQCMSLGRSYLFSMPSFLNGVLMSFYNHHTNILRDINS